MLFKKNANENLRGVVTPVNGGQKIDLAITSQRMSKPVKLKTDFAPQSNFVKLVSQLVDEMDQLDTLPNEAQEERKSDKFEIKEYEHTNVMDTQKSYKDGQQIMFQQYELVQSKLGKFKNTELEVLYFGVSTQGSVGAHRSKQMISLDQNNVYRIHKVKLVKVMADKDYLLKDTDFPNKTDPNRIPDLKKATFRQLKDVLVISDYVFCSLL